MILIRQREFVDARGNVETGTRGAATATNALGKYITGNKNGKGFARYGIAGVSDIAKKAGGIDKIKDKQLQNALQNESIRNDVLYYMEHGNLDRDVSKKVAKETRRAEVAQELAADAGVKLAGQKDTVRTANGYTFKTKSGGGDRKIKVQASQDGQVATRVTEGAHTGNAVTTGVSKATAGRSQKMQNIQNRGVVANEYIPKANMSIGKGRETHQRHPKTPKGKPGIINTNPNPGITFTDVPKNTTMVTTTTPNRTVQVSTGMQQTTTGQTVPTPVKVTTHPTVPKNTTSTTTPQPSSTYTVPRVNNSQPQNTSNNFFRNTWNTNGGKAALIGAGVLGTAATAYGIHKLRENNRKRAVEEERRRSAYRY